MVQFSVPYERDSACRGVAAEIRIIVNDKNLVSLEAFINNSREMYPDQKYLIEYQVDEMDEEAAQSFYCVINKIYEDDITVSAEESLYVYCPDIKSIGWNIVNHTTLCVDWDTYYRLLNIPYITDIRIGGGLMFELPEVAEMARRRKKRLRCICNEVYKSITYFDKERCYLDAFVRPEDIERYSQYIDIFELENTIFGDPTSMDTVYNVYAVDKHWDGPFNILFNHTKMDIEGNRLLADWGKYRIDCGRVCMKGTTCRICPSQLSIANSFKSAGLIFNREQENKNEV